MEEELKYEEIFNEKGVINITKEDFNLIMQGNNRFLTIVDNKDEKTLETDIYNALKNMRYEYFYNDNAIIYIKAKDNINLMTQVKIIEEIRKSFYTELNIIYGYR